MVSSELPEILGMSDRVMVMHEGRITGILEKDEAAGGYRILNREELELQAEDVRRFLEREEE